MSHTTTYFTSSLRALLQLHKRMLQLLSGMPFNEQHEISRFHWYAFELHPLFTPMAYMWRNKRGSTNPSKAQRLTETSFPQHHITEPYTQLQAQTDLTRFEFHKCFWIVLKYFKTCCLSMNHQNYTTTCEIRLCRDGKYSCAVWEIFQWAQCRHTSASITPWFSHLRLFGANHSDWLS